MKTYVTHIFVRPIVEVEGKRVKSPEAYFVETTTSKDVASRVAFWRAKAKTWNEGQHAAKVADPAYVEKLVAEDYSAITTLASSDASFGKVFKFPTK